LTGMFQRRTGEKTPSEKRPPAALTLLLAAVVAVAAMTPALGRDPGAAHGVVSNGRLFCPVRRADFVETVRITGKLRAEKTTRVTGGLSWHPIAQMIAEGSDVDAGDVIVRLDCSELEEDVQRLKHDVAAAEASREAARAAFEMAQVSIEKEIEEIQAKLAVARARLQIEQVKPLPEERKAAEAELKEAKANLEYTGYCLEVSRQLSADGIVSDRHVRQAELAQYTARLAHRQTLQKMEDTLAGARSEDIESAAAGLTQVQISLDEANETKQQRLKQAEAIVRTAENDLTNLKQQLSRIEEDLEKSRIRAPHPGKVFYRSNPRVDIGEMMWSGWVFADLADVSSLVLEGRVRECDSRLVEVGQSALVTLLSKCGQSFRGAVVKVGNTLVEDDREPTMKYLEIEIRLDEMPPAVRPGMNAYANVEVNRIEQALVIPQAAMTDAGVTLKTSSGLRKRKINVVASNGAVAAIESGLAEGELVLLCPEE